MCVSCEYLDDSSTFTTDDCQDVASGSSTGPDSIVDPSTPIVLAKTRQRLSAKFQNWRNSHSTWGEETERWLNQAQWPLCSQKEDAPAFCGAELVGADRNQNSVKTISLFVSDHDDGQTMAESAEFARAAGIETVIVPSFNCGSTECSFKRDDYITWCRNNDRSPELTEAAGRDFLKHTGRLRPQFADQATYDGAPPVQSTRGFYYVFKTPPREKHRCIRIIKHPIVVADYMVGDTTHTQFFKAAGEAYTDALRSIGGTFDGACKDVCRAFYDVGQPNKIGCELPAPIHVRGKAFDIKPFLIAALERIKAGKSNASKRSRQAEAGTDTKTKGSHDRVIFEGRNLTAWAGKAAKVFDMEELFRRHHLDRADRAGGGLGVRCFHESHGGTSPTETWVMNGNGERGFTLACSGASGGCPDIRDRLVRLVKYLEAGLVSIEDLEDPSLNGVPVPFDVSATTESIRQAVESLGNDCNHDDYAPILDGLALLADMAFTAEMCALISKKARGVNKSDLVKAVKERQKKSAGAKEQTKARQATSSMALKAQKAAELAQAVFAGEIEKQDALAAAEKEGISTLVFAAALDAAPPHCEIAGSSLKSTH